MYKQRVLLFTFLFCTCGISTYFSQISSTTASVGGCAPFAVTYAAPAGATSSNWNFGNTLTSTLSSGSFNYVNAGTYTITYSGSSGTGPVNFKVIAYVIPKPTAIFTINQPTNNCSPKTVTITEQSIGPSIVSWNWTYGDGGGASHIVGGVDTYTYVLSANSPPGNYSITLQVYDIYGCTDQKTIGTVSVFPSPNVVITSNPANPFSCISPFSVAFTASNSAGTNLSYAWNFGNNQTSALQTPGSIVFTNPAVYLVTLTVTGNGCSSTGVESVTLNPTTLNVTVPPTICKGQNFIANVQTNQAVTLWNLGSGYTPYFSTGNVTMPAYPHTGSRTMTITAGTGSCQVVVTKTVFVDSVVANFTTLPPSSSCSSPFLVPFVNLSTTNAAQFTWRYPSWQIIDTFSVSGPNPTISLEENSLNPYTIYSTLSPYSMYAPSVTLIAVSAAGCRDSIHHTLDTIMRPTAWFNKTAGHGCAPLAETLSDASFIFPMHPIVSYTWSNGATPPVTNVGTGSIIPNWTFTYNTVGTYTPFLIIKTANGCIDESFIDTVIVASPPVVSFAISPTGTICPNTPLQIVNTSAPAVLSQVKHWHVDGDDGFFSGCINDPNPSWNFSHIGQHTLSLTGYVHECPGTSSVLDSIFVAGPIVQSRYTTNCTSRLSVVFNSELQDVQGGSLDFGDPSPIHSIVGIPGSVVSDVVTHVYASTGDYVVTLTGTNSANNCAISTYTMPVYVRNVTASISIPSSPVLCQNVSTLFTASTSVNASTGCERGYIWYVDNLPPLDTVYPYLSVAFSTTGMHLIKMTVKDLNSCTDTARLAVRVSSVTPSFSMSLVSPPSTVCVNSTVQFTNTSTSFPGDPITGYFWNFNDLTGISTQTNPAHTFATANTPYTIYSVALTASNSAGCVQVATKTVQVIQPNSAFSFLQNYICVGPTLVTFTAQVPHVSYTLNVGGNGVTTSTNIVLSYIFTSPGPIPVYLTVQDANGCVSDDTSPQTVYAQQTPTAGFIFSSPKSTGNSNVICSPATVSFSDASQPSQAYTYTWNVGSTSPIVHQPVISYPYSNTSTTMIPISLTVTSVPNGCRDVDTLYFTVYSPRADIALSKTLICLGDPVTFNIIDTTGGGIKGWVWDYGDASATGGTITANSAPPSSTVHPYTSYPPTGTASVSLIYYSSQYACFDRATAQVKLIKPNVDIRVNTDLTVADSVHCLRIKDNFYNTSPVSTSNVKWQFGDGSTSSVQNPSYTYPLPGIYQVTLSVTEGAMSCNVLTARGMTINPLPIASILSPDSVCLNKPINLAGTGSTTAGPIAYQWSPIGSVQNFTGSIIQTSLSVSTTLSLTVSDNNGCVSLPAVKHIYVQTPPPYVSWDTAVVIGQLIPMSTRTGSNFSYTWAPTTDLSCPNCSHPVSSSTVNITYSATVADNLGCYLVSDTYSVIIEPKTTVDVPTAFTPNGDGVNDVIYVDGWGIRKLNFFRIFNRWGQLLFESNDIKIGWDGTFNGIPQNMETYVYQVSVETYLDAKPVLKTSSFRLIR